MVQSFINFFTTYVSSYWPVVVFILLLFAGLNLPVSEDALIVLSAGISFADHRLIIPNWIGLISGIYISDIISYFFGFFIAKGAKHLDFFKKKLTPRRMAIVAKTLDDYGFRTFIVCRFIPFGIRNILFMGSGFVNLSLKKFLLYDGVACLISCTTLYTLILFLGQKANLGYKIGGIVLFVILIICATVLGIRVIKKESSSQTEQNQQENQ